MKNEVVDIARRRFLALFVAIVNVVSCGGAPKDRPANGTVIMIDLSGTFRSRATSALEQTQRLLSTMGDTKLRRWERGRDRVSIVALDASPAMLWSGTLPELGEFAKQGLPTAIAGRADYAGCTDVARGFAVAARTLAEGGYSDKYLFVFSDLVSEPPTASLSKCASAKRPSPPSDDFDWAALASISIDVFWVPPAQALPWKRAVAEQGLGNFRVYTPSESERAILAPPQRPKRQITETETQESRSRLFAGVLAVVAGLAALIGALFAVVALARRHRRAQRAARSGRVVRRQPMAQIRRI